MIAADQRWPFTRAPIDGIIASRFEYTATWKMGQVRQGAGDYRQAPSSLLNSGRVTLQQFSCIRVSRLQKHIACGATFNHLARVHDNHLVAQFGDHAQVVRDKEDGATEIPLQLLQAVNDLDFQRCIKRGCRFIGD